MNVRQQSGLQQGHDEVTNQISDFIQGIRIQSEVRVPQTTPNGGVQRNMNWQQQEEQPRPGTSGYSPHVNAAREKAGRLILQAEQHKAAVNAPTGMDDTVASNFLQEGIFPLNIPQYDMPNNVVDTCP